MSVSNILVQTGVNAGKIKPELIIGGGGGGQVNSVVGSSAINVSADPVNPVVSVAFLNNQDLMVGTGANAGAVLGVGANGTYLGVNNAGVLAYSNPPQQGIPYNAQGQMIYSGVAPGFADTLLNIGGNNQVLGVNAGVPSWTDAGGSGLVTATAPLKEYNIAGASNLAIDFVAKGDLVVGAGAQVGGNPIAGLVLPVGADNAVLTADSTVLGGVYGMKWEVPTPVTGGQVIRVTTPGTTTIPVPTTLNQQIQLIDVASTTNTFVYEAGALHPNNSTFTPAGNFTNQIGGVFYVVVYGNDSQYGGQGQVWIYEPNVLVPANGTWTWKLGTAIGSGEFISCGALLNPDPTTFGGYSASNMVFGGSFTDIRLYTNNNPGIPVVSQNFVYWEPTTPGEVVSPGFTTYSINPFPKSGLGLCGVATNGNASNIKFIAYSPQLTGGLFVTTPTGSIDYNYIALITADVPPRIVPLQGGVVLNPPNTTPNGIIQSTTSASGILNMNWDFNGNLVIVGGFQQAVINGAGVGNNSYCALSYDPTPGSINGFIALGAPNVSVNGSINTFRPCYDPSVGSIMAGDFIATPTQNIVFVSPAGTLQQVEEADRGNYFNAIALDGGAYVGVTGFAGAMFGLDNGYAVAFGTQQNTLDWFIPKIAQGFPLSYIGMTGKQMYQGYFKVVAGQTTISFAPSKLRYSLYTGTTGLASIAVLNSTYSSMTLIADTTVPAPYEWDLVAYTGNISFS
jgi:hypothetical protein